jgi:hypothetical protein
MKMKLAFLMALAGLWGCNDDSDDDDPAVMTGAEFIQVERLARPAINEGLFHTNDYLNAVNSISPAQEPGALVGAIAAEAVAALDAFDGADGVDHLTAGAAIGAFIPDVMRIDTTGPSGYGNALNMVGSPVRGRRIEDDVIDITYSYLITGLTAAVSDGVSYAGSAGNEGQPGHKPVQATFPYLARPN